jgi:SAM-dependent methyltransferase
VSHPAIKRLRAGQKVDDRTFDEVYPPWIRGLSRTFWTPVQVARRAAEWLVTEPGARVLDVGSGVGKFCLVAALTSEGSFTGVEQRAHLADAARDTARRFRVRRCTFITGNAQDLDWAAFDGLYLFNPFSEHIPGFHAIDDAIDRRRETYTAYVRMVEERLDALPAGARVVTFHGFGGEFPPGWEEQGLERLHGGPLSLWVKG